jgi:uncharacterized protein (TIGR03437 family)
MPMLKRGSSFVVCLGLAAYGLCYGQQYTITTFAGNGTAGFLDGSDLSAAQLNFPNALALDSKGALYIADTANHRVRMITAGSISTVAGNGTQGNSGNGGAATAANINSPGGVAVDSAGTIYISETANHVVRKVSGGNITLFAGDGNATYGGDGGPATGAQLNGPTGLVLDSAGNLYIADTKNNLIRKVTKDGTLIASYVGGTGPTAGRLNNPTAIWFDSTGALYISDTGNRRIAKFANGALTTFAGNGTAGFAGDGGSALTAQLNNPIGIVTDSNGGLLIADSNNSRIRRLAPDGNIYTIAGKGGGSYTGDNGPALAAFLNFPRGIALASDGRIYIADTQNSVIRLLTPAPGPAVNSGGVINVASGAVRLSPGMLASVFGTNLSAVTTSTSLGFASNALPTNVNGVGVSVNGVAAPLLYLSPGQINFQVPWSTPSSGTAAISVSINGGPSNTVQIPLATAAPGLFTYPNGAAITQNSDFTLHDAAHPAAAGGTIVAYLTGSGPISPAQVDGVPNSQLSFMTLANSAKIGTANAVVSFAGLSPGFVGLAQMNIVVPAGLAAGAYPLTVTIDGQTSNAGNVFVK